MVGQKTHEQQLRTFEGRENTKNADKDFDASADLHKTPEERALDRRSQDLRAHPDIQDEDRSILRGTGQESRGHKG